MFVLFKYFLCSCLFIGIYAKSVAEIKAKFMTYGIECSKQHPVTPDEMLLLHQHKIPDSSNAKCLLACVYRRVEWMNDQGVFDIEKAYKMVEKEHADEPHKVDNGKKLFDACKKVNDATVSDGEKGCDRASLLAECLIENAPKMGFELVM